MLVGNRSLYNFRRSPVISYLPPGSCREHFPPSLKLVVTTLPCDLNAASLSATNQRKLLCGASYRRADRRAAVRQTEVRTHDPFERKVWGEEEEDVGSF